MSDEKRRIRELEDELSRLRTLLDAPDNVMCFSLDTEYRYTAFNRAHRLFVRQKWGVDIQQGMAVPDVLGTPEEREAAIRHFDRALSGETYMLKRQYRLSHGGPEHYQNTYFPIVEDGRITGVAVFAHDITEWSEKEKEGHKYRSIFDKALEGIFRSTPQGRFIEANREMARILGYESPLDLMDSVRDISGQLYCDAEDRERVFSVLRSQGVVKDFETRMRRKDGSVIWVEFNCRSEKDTDGRTLYLEGKLTDISGKKAAQRSTELRRQQAAQADKMAALGVLVAGLAHEINNPASHLSLNLPLLRDVWRDALHLMDEFAEDHGEFLLGGLQYGEVREQLPYLMQEMIDATGRISSMVTRLKDYSRQAPVDHREPVDLNRVLDVAGTFLGHRLKSHGAELEAHPADPPVHVNGDEQRLIQVMLNLLLNACDALPESGGRITVRIGTDGSGPFVAVTDTGRGIDPADLKHIQDPFYTTRRQEGGTGLGLSISATIMHEHGGSLDFQSEPGRGTTATMRFPAALCS
ncbi:PAS domain-containing sensor histidine kinase [Salidesulfovibrio brasiliensis]|uniref:PAS domain-containing sensor histidine kinase n=1 Tax=Salidesulfovibrio brasiliensis TaxID=221711 RepID=UPI0006D19FE6|nr:PAS domain-containing sensor histidine kinase [Salidesulfovibrio brasiliensis]